MNCDLTYTEGANLFDQLEDALLVGAEGQVVHGEQGRHGNVG